MAPSSNGNANIQANRYYGSNTSYYVEPNAASVLNNLTVSSVSTLNGKVDVNNNLEVDGTIISRK